MTFAPWKEPFERFGTVFAEAKRAIAKDPNAMSLATVDAKGQPAVRTVLLKDFDERGFVFFTNSTSSKGQALLSAGRAGLNFYWRELDQQVRIEGEVERVGVSSERGTRFTRDAGAPPRRTHREIRRPARAAPPALGWLSGEAAAHRVLEGPRVSAALARAVREGGHRLGQGLAQPLSLQFGASPDSVAASAATVAVTHPCPSEVTGVR
jgi:hypothetical protein